MENDFVEKMYDKIKPDEKEPDLVEGACALIYLIIVVPVAVAGTFIDGWAMVTLWRWFVMGAFGLVALQMKTAIGIALIFDLFKSRYVNYNKPMKKLLPTFLFMALIFPLTAVGFGWLVLLFL